MRDHLVRVGIDTVRCFVTSLDKPELVAPKLVSLEALGGLEHVLLFARIAHPPWRNLEPTRKLFTRTLQGEPNVRKGHL